MVKATGYRRHQALISSWKNITCKKEFGVNWSKLTPY